MKLPYLVMYPPGTQDAVPHGLRKLPHNQAPGSVTGHVIGPGDPIGVEGHTGLDRGPPDRARNIDM